MAKKKDAEEKVEAVVEEPKIDEKIVEMPKVGPVEIRERAAIIADLAEAQKAGKPIDELVAELAARGIAKAVGKVR